MIDPDTRSRLRIIEQLAERSGHDLFEDLDRVRLLLTADRAREISVAALYSFLNQLEDQPTQALVDIGGGTNCAADAHKGCIEFLKFVIKQYEGDQK